MVWHVAWYTPVRLSLKEALLGFERTVLHLDAHPVVLAEDGTTQHGQVCACVCVCVFVCVCE